MKVDHLVADVDRAGVRALGHRKPESAIEREHRLSVLHGKGDVIEAPDASEALRGHGHSARCGQRAFEESASGRACSHCAPHRVYPAQYTLGARRARPGLKPSISTLTGACYSGSEI